MKLPAVPLPAALSPDRIATLFDAEKAALAHAKFLAWWDGVDFDPDGFAQKRAEALAAAQAAPKPLKKAKGEKTNKAVAEAKPPPPAGAQEQDLFEAPLEPDPPRVEALSKVWGKGRGFPVHEDDERDLIASLALEPGGALCLIGTGGAGAVKAAMRVHAGLIMAYEWRSEIVPNWRAQVGRLEHTAGLTARGFELDSFLPAPDAYDGVISFDELTYASRPSRFCQQIMRTLKPGGAAILETYCRRGSPDLRAAFATGFAEPALLEADVLVDTLYEAGLQLEANDDVTDDHIRLVRESFKRLSGVLESSPGLAPEVAREIAWEAEAWRARLGLLVKRDISRRRLLVMKPLS